MESNALSPRELRRFAFLSGRQKAGKLTPGEFEEWDGLFAKARGEVVKDELAPVGNALWAEYYGCSVKQIRNWINDASAAGAPAPPFSDPPAMERWWPSVYKHRPSSKIRFAIEKFLSGKPPVPGRPSTPSPAPSPTPPEDPIDFAPPVESFGTLDSLSLARIAVQDAQAIYDREKQRNNIPGIQQAGRALREAQQNLSTLEQRSTKHLLATGDLINGPEASARLTALWRTVPREMGSVIIARLSSLHALPQADLAAAVHGAIEAAMAHTRDHLLQLTTAELYALKTEKIAG